MKEGYVRALVSSIEKKSFSGKIKSVYMGGGTPSVLSENQLERIFRAINKFDLEDGCEITVEVNPESVSESLIKTLMNLGVNRISMGIQSFDDGELKELGRRADSKTCVSAFEILRNCGVKNISIDIMLAIPKQTKESLRKTLEKAVSLNPEHISAYLLKIEENTVFGKRGYKEADEDFQRSLYLFTSSFLKSYGYEHYEISNFAKKGYRAYHNSSYWRGAEYIAFGCGASGFEKRIRYRIPENIVKFIEAHGDITPIIEEELDDEDVLKESIIFPLRTSEGIEKTVLNEKQISYMNTLVKGKLAGENGCGFSLNEEGFLVSNKIIEDLLYLL